MSITMPPDVLEKTWDSIDWATAEEKLAEEQKKLTLAAFREDENAIQKIQMRIVRNLDFKCLAVRHVVKAGSSPGVDGVRWKTPAEMMGAAISLTSKGYKAQPLRQITIVSKNTGRERKQGLPTYYDRAMSTLYGYSFLPVAEAHAERKSFAFRPGRSAQDALAYALEALKGTDAPSIIVGGDVESFFAKIQHRWLLENAPVDKKVLRELLSAGIIFDGELFPSDGEGITEGSNLSPYLGNFVLDGLQKYIYQGLHGTTYPKNYRDGNLIRFADDIFIAVYTYEEADKVLDLLAKFLAERGLNLSRKKTQIKSINDGITFLSQTFIKKNDYIYCYPSDKAVDRFISNITEVILAWRKSQRELILQLNKKLKGFASYHRSSDATEAFERIDRAVQTALLEAVKAKHPRMAPEKRRAKYWYEESNGRHCFALPEDRSVRVMRLGDTLLIDHSKIRTSANPYLDTEYMEARTHNKAIQNVTGRYRGIWERQAGRCFYCGRPILIDQPRAVVQIDLSRPPSMKNSAYIHKICEMNEHEIYLTMKDVTAMRPYDVLTVLGEIKEEPPKGARTKKKDIPDNWKHIALKRLLAKSTAASVTMSFKDLEKLEGRALPKSARQGKNWWYPRKNCNTIAEAWLTEGYTLKYVDVKKERFQLVREDASRTKLVIPAALTSQKLPDDAVFELEQHMQYIIKKYGL